MTPSVLVHQEPSVSMRDLFRRRQQAAGDPQQPAAVSTATLAGAVAIGEDGGSGMVARHRAFTDPDIGRRVPMLAGAVESVGQTDVPRTPDSYYTDRQLRGGVTAFPHFAEFVQEPGNTGGHTVITGRVPFVIAEPVLVEDEPQASYREVPTPVLCRRVPTVGDHA
jgi:hypothetical protein